MSSLVLSGDTSGQVSLTVPAIAGSNTATIPASTGNVLMDSTVGVCRAWVKWTGGSTPVIAASFNVSSITRNATGDFTVNFSATFSDANYAAVATGGNTNGNCTTNGSNTRTTQTTTAFSLFYINANSATATDPNIMAVAIFR